jgi:hypothetical protein
MNMAAIHGWVTRQLDFMLAFPQAPVETDLYMEIPRGFIIDDDDSGEFALKLVNNLYEKKTSRQGMVQISLKWIVQKPQIHSK